ncbi:MAG TPA: fibronectin type III domain-containing protein [Candidatus Angelobacter sp.]|jgi:phosphodiesterase/alkaline phosphatase D-like protein|nr:fibronectin type III domain-containing protein [Candidatus Angelobacter sp.]
MKNAIILATVVLLTFIMAVAQNNAGKSIPPTQSSQEGNKSSQVITNGPVAELVSDSDATLGWSVSSGAGAMSVKYGTDRKYMNQTADATAGSNGSNFHARLRNLTPETQYYFQIMQNGAPVGGVGTFRTVAAGASPIKSRATIPE